MAQFDVHANPGARRAGYPYLVVVQSAYFESRPTRVVIPLIAPSVAPRPSEVAPEFIIEGRAVYLDPFQIFAIPVSALGLLVASLADDASAARIIAAIDEVITTAFR